MKKTLEQRRIAAVIISITIIIAIIFSIGAIYNSWRENYEHYIVVENKTNPLSLNERIVVLENCETGETCTKNIPNRTEYAIFYREGKIVKIKE